MTQPYLRFMQGDEWADLCYKPAQDQAGTATVEVYMNDDGGDLNGGKSTRVINPEIFTITIIEVNDPPTFTEGAQRVTVLEDSGKYNQPWASDIKPGPSSEERAMQQLDRFDVLFENDADRVLFDEMPNIDVENGFLKFTPSRHANTISGPVRLTVNLWDNPTCMMCVQLRSLAPYPTLEINITPVNDPPSFSPPSNKDITMREDDPPLTLQWAADLCIGGTLPDDCVTSEADPGRENQRLLFLLTLLPNSTTFYRGSYVAATQFFPEPFTTLTMDETGLLTIQPNENVHGNYSVSVVLKDSGDGENTFNPVEPIIFNINIEAVNDPPFYNTTVLPTIVTVEEDHGAFLKEDVIGNLRAGPIDEEDQQLRFWEIVDHPEMFEEQPKLTPVFHHSGGLHGDLSFKVKDNIFGETSVKYLLYDDGGPAPDNSTIFREFAIIVTPVNAAPWFAPPSNLAYSEGDGNEGENSYHVLGFISNYSAGVGEDTHQRVEYLLRPDADVFREAPQINAYGSLTFGLYPNWWGEVKINITVHDVSTTGQSLNDSLPGNTAVFSLNVANVNDAPSFALSETFLRLPACTSRDGCEHFFSNFLTNISVGEYEESIQTLLRLDTSKIESTRGGITVSGIELLDRMHLKVSTLWNDDFDGTETHIFRVTAQDSGGTNDGGHDTTTKDFTIVVTTDVIDVITPQDDYALLVDVQPKQRLGAVIDGPSFTLVGKSTAGGVLPYYDAYVTMLSAGGDVRLETELSPYLNKNGSTLSWPYLRVGAPGLFYFELNVAFNDGSNVSVSNKTNMFSVQTSAELALKGLSSGNAYPDESDLRTNDVVFTIEVATNADLLTYNETQLVWDLSENGTVLAGEVVSAAVDVGSGMPRVLDVLAVSILRTFEFKDGTVLQITIGKDRGLPGLQKDGILSLDISKRILRMLDVKPVTHRSAVSLVGYSSDNALVETALRFPLWSAPSLYLSTVATETAGPQGQTMLGSSEEDAEKAFYIKSTGFFDGVLPANGSVGTQPLLDGCCNLCVNVATSVQECCKGCFKGASHVADQVETNVNSTKALSLLQSVVASLKLSEEAESRMPLAQRVTSAAYEGYNKVRVTMKLFGNEKLTIFLANTVDLKMARDVVGAASGSVINVVPSSTLGDVHEDFRDSKYKDFATEFIVFFVLFLLAAVAGLFFNVFLLSDLGVMLAIFTTNCQPATQQRNFESSSSWFLSAFLKGPAVYICIALIAAHFIASKATKRHLFFPSLSISSAAFLYPFLLLSMTYEGNAAWAVPIFVVSAVLLAVFFVVYLALAFRERELRHAFIFDLFDAPTAIQRFVGPATTYSPDVHPKEGGETFTGNISHKKTSSRYRSTVQAKFSLVNGVALYEAGGGIPFHAVDMIRVTVVTVVMSIPSSGMDAIKAQLSMSMVVLAAFLASLFAHKALWMQSPLICVLRFASVLFQLLSLSCLLFPIIAKDGSQASNSTGSTWDAAKAMPYLLFVSLFISCLALLASAVVWYIGKTQFKQIRQNQRAKEATLQASSQGSDAGRVQSWSNSLPQTQAEHENPLVNVFPVMSPIPATPEASAKKRTSHRTRGEGVCTQCSTALPPEGAFCPTCGIDVADVDFDVTSERSSL